MHLIYTRCSSECFGYCIKQTNKCSLHSNGGKINDEKGKKIHPFTSRTSRIFIEPLLCYQVLLGTWDNLVNTRDYNFRPQGFKCKQG